MAWLRPDVEMSNCFAARVKLRSSATTRNAESTLSSSRMTVSIRPGVGSTVPIRPVWTLARLLTVRQQPLLILPSTRSERPGVR